MLVEWNAMSFLRLVAFVAIATNKSVCAFPHALSTTTAKWLFASSSSSSSRVGVHHMVSARDLLYQDQQDAMGRRALEEEQILGKPKPLTAPKLKPKTPKGTGFGGATTGSSRSTPEQRLSVEQAKVVHRDGVLRINNVLSPQLADQVRAHVLQQQELAKRFTEQHPELATSLYGVEPTRTARCDLQLSLIRDEDDENSSASSNDNVVVDALAELLGPQGTLRHVYENLVSTEGDFYELAAIITDPGSKRQQIHPDLPFQDPAPLYVIFLALQDVTEDMGPTSFLLKTHKSNEYSSAGATLKSKDEILKKADCYVSTLSKGDCVLFDARILHCGNANASSTTRAMFNFSFRNPKIEGNLGYPGSIRPGYCGKLTLGDITTALDSYQKGETKEPFAMLGNGL